MTKEPKFIWDGTAGVARCHLNDGKNIYEGVATCSELDEDMKSEKTGCQIALWRAEIKYYLHLRDNEIKPALNALRHTYASMQHSPQFNPKSYESKALRRNIHKKEFDLYVVKTMLADKKRCLKQYIKEKDIFYNRIRSMRKTDKED